MHSHLKIFPATAVSVPSSRSVSRSAKLGSAARRDRARIMHRVLACKHSAQAVAPLFSRPRASAALRPAERVSSSSKRPFTLQRVRATAASASSGMSARAAATDEVQACCHGRPRCNILKTPFTNLPAGLDDRRRRSCRRGALQDGKQRREQDAAFPKPASLLLPWNLCTVNRRLACR